MALKLSVGVSKKVGQPNYGSLGAQCHLEYDLDVTLLVQDREQFQQRVRQAYQACSQAVEDELARHRRGLAVSEPTPDAQAASSPGTSPSSEPSQPAEPQHPEANGSGPAPGDNGAAAKPKANGGNTIKGGNGANPRTAAGRRAATSSQVQALARLAARQSIDLQPLLAKSFGVQTCEALSVVEASQLIHWLQSQPLPENTSP